jgi:hypothetical protein
MKTLKPLHKEVLQYLLWSQCLRFSLNTFNNKSAVISRKKFAAHWFAEKVDWRKSKVHALIIFDLLTFRIWCQHEKLHRWLIMHWIVRIFSLTGDRIGISTLDYRRAKKLPQWQSSRIFSLDWNSFCLTSLWFVQIFHFVIYLLFFHHREWISASSSSSASCYYFP